MSQRRARSSRSIVREAYEDVSHSSASGSLDIGFDDDSYSEPGVGGASRVKKHVVRSHFPETWLFQLKPVDSRGQAVVSLKAPDTLTSWTGEAVCMSSKAGIGLAKPASILVKKVIDDTVIQ